MTSDWPQERFTCSGRQILITATHTRGGYFIKLFDGWLSPLRPFAIYFVSGGGITGDKLEQLAKNLIATAKTDIEQGIVQPPAREDQILSKTN